MDDKKLIELVYLNEELYNLSNPKYLDCNLKEKIWTQIGEEMKHPGNLCKTRWSNIRDNYRKSLRRIATKPLQDSNKIKKYKYAGALTFLDAYFQVREPISSITTEDTIEEEEESTTLQETEYFDIGTINTVEVKNEVDEDCSECQETQQRSWSKNMAHTQKRKCQQPQTSASIPMNYLIEEKNKTESQVHSVDAFLAAIAQTLKTFTPYYLNALGPVECKFKGPYRRSDLVDPTFGLTKSGPLKPISWDGVWESERRGVASQPTKVSFRANKNRYITETVDGASYRTGLAEKPYVWKHQFSREQVVITSVSHNCRPHDLVYAAYA
uniref:MADF domain-containing protein n=1 Tax=Timema cristinae TaxID=61476 RepID=A0A7R9DH92_TIMCR|nr:unnamed protein product [Timema cristinae]